MPRLLFFQRGPHDMTHLRKLMTFQAFPLFTYSKVCASNLTENTENLPADQQKKSITAGKFPEISLS